MRSALFGHGRRAAKPLAAAAIGERERESSETLRLKIGWGLVDEFQTRIQKNGVRNGS